MKTLKTMVFALMFVSCLSLISCADDPEISPVPDLPEQVLQGGDGDQISQEPD